jgi:hypothetical protein
MRSWFTARSPHGAKGYFCKPFSTDQIKTSVLPLLSAVAVESQKQAARLNVQIIGAAGTYNPHGELYNGDGVTYTGTPAAAARSLRFHEVRLR